MPSSQSTRRTSLIYPIPDDFWECPAFRAIEPEVAYVGPIPSPLAALREIAWSTPYTQYVYALMSELGGDTVYVGLTSKPYRRLSEHATQKPWWGNADKLVLFRVEGMDRYEAEHNARLFETGAIRALRPLHNVVGALR